MKAWKYSRGEWTEIDYPFEWGENENWDDALKRAGYNQTTDVQFGSEWWNCIKAYTKRDGVYPVLLEVSPLGDAGGEMVVIDDFPSLMMFLRDYAPLFSLSAIEGNITEMTQVMDRAFRAWHGHDSSDVCRRCDPYAMENRARLRAGRDKGDSTLKKLIAGEC